ncbi:hypothetical protein EX30DRAFT_162126 [Ascodesmis nigricans]|uniref:Uncharacterized protein n=1 Tax=Ascodesmis nigricans TaxID=341454 RepID=A0A4S2MME5_9PEZI|nr:hypothetical protein EX30DRAFT_162126 [Ascodesmis nigricans]
MALESYIRSLLRPTFHEACSKQRISTVSRPNLQPYRGRNGLRLGSTTNGDCDLEPESFNFRTRSRSKEILKGYAKDSRANISRQHSPTIVIPQKRWKKTVGKLVRRSSSVASNSTGINGRMLMPPLSIFPCGTKHPKLGGIASARCCSAWSMCWQGSLWHMSGRDISHQLGDAGCTLERRKPWKFID